MSFNVTTPITFKTFKNNISNVIDFGNNEVRNFVTQKQGDLIIRDSQINKLTCLNAGDYNNVLSIVENPSSTISNSFYVIKYNNDLGESIDLNVLKNMNFVINNANTEKDVDIYWFSTIVTDEYVDQTLGIYENLTTNLIKIDLSTFTNVITFSDFINVLKTKLIENINLDVQIDDTTKDCTITYNNDFVLYDGKFYNDVNSLFTVESMSNDIKMLKWVNFNDVYDLNNSGNNNNILNFNNSLYGYINQLVPINSNEWVNLFDSGITWDFTSPGYNTNNLITNGYYTVPDDGVYELNGHLTFSNENNDVNTAENSVRLARFVNVADQNDVLAEYKAHININKFDNVQLKLNTIKFKLVKDVQYKLEVWHDSVVPSSIVDLGDKQRFYNYVNIYKIN